MTPTQAYIIIFEHVYTSPQAKSEEKKIPDLVAKLFEHYKKHTELLHPVMQDIAEKEGIDRAVCDYIAGMTDQYAIQMYSEFFVPKRWQF